ncbi:hypothetical protein P4O66_006852 [Electrophorus voltai]|uniref:Alpha/beta hydrolase domain-containing protein 17C n=1 Tax=Electrophorus voltai TaxID=2609070 RepID=A0AAD9E149_9TELE|nr:hypothetical protein P4O66_006852 [Electrophorus voltai]
MNGFSLGELCWLFCCPPCPSRIAAKLAFLPPEPTYSVRADASGACALHLSERADWQYSQRELDAVEVFTTRTGRGNRLGCMFVRCAPSSRYTLLFSHGNAVDLGQMCSFYIGLGSRINCNVFSYDYSGYGVSTGKPSEKNLYADIEAAWQVLRTNLPQALLKPPGPLTVLLILAMTRMLTEGRNRTWNAAPWLHASVAPSRLRWDERLGTCGTCPQNVSCPGRLARPCGLAPPHPGLPRSPSRGPRWRASVNPPSVCALRRHAGLSRHPARARGCGSLRSVEFSEAGGLREGRGAWCVPGFDRSDALITTQLRRWRASDPVRRQNHAERCTFICLLGLTGVEENITGQFTGGFVETRRPRQQTTHRPRVGYAPTSRRCCSGPCLRVIASPYGTSDGLRPGLLGASFSLVAEGLAWFTQYLGRTSEMPWASLCEMSREAQQILPACASLKTGVLREGEIVGPREQDGRKRGAAGLYCEFWPQTTGKCLLWQKGVFRKRSLPCAAFTACPLTGPCVCQVPPSLPCSSSPWLATQQLPVPRLSGKTRSGLARVWERLETSKPLRNCLASGVCRRRYGVTPENIILYGQSIGTVPTVDLATRYECAAVILHSPLMSGLRVAFPDTRKTYCFDAFPSIDKVSKVASPVLVIHGTEDEVIDFSHGLAIYERCPRAVEPLWVEGAGHNDIELYAQYLERLKQFISFELATS